MYVYIHDDPIDWVDPVGLWKAKGHSDLTYIAMIGLIGEERIDVAINSNLDVDRWDNFLNRPAHYMAGSDAEAEALARTLLEIAISLENGCQYDRAMKFLGRGLHTIQDKYAHAVQGVSSDIHSSPDDPSQHRQEYFDAAIASGKYVEAFVVATGKKARKIGGQIVQGSPLPC